MKLSSLCEQTDLGQLFAVFVGHAFPHVFSTIGGVHQKRFSLVVHCQVGFEFLA
jgi:hypothetical protein